MPEPAVWEVRVPLEAPDLMLVDKALQLELHVFRFVLHALHGHDRRRVVRSLEYVLTDKGLDLQPVLLAMTHWGDVYKPNPRGARRVFVERATGKPIARMSARSQDGRALRPREVSSVPGPRSKR